MYFVDTKLYAATVWIKFPQYFNILDPFILFGQFTPEGGQCRGTTLVPRCHPCTRSSESSPTLHCVIRWIPKSLKRKVLPPKNQSEKLRLTPHTHSSVFLALLDQKHCALSLQRKYMIGFCKSNFSFPHLWLFFVFLKVHWADHEDCKEAETAGLCYSWTVLCIQRKQA